MIVMTLNTFFHTEICTNISESIGHGIQMVIFFKYIFFKHISYLQNRLTDITSLPENIVLSYNFV